MKTFIKQNLFTATGVLNSKTFTETWFLKNGFKSQYEKLNSIYVKNDCSNFAECVYLASNNITRKTCKMCDNHTSFVNFENGYREYCCVKCSKADPEHIQKGVNTFKNNDIDAITKKRKATSLKNYGVDNPSKAEEVKMKKVQSSIHKYGTENVFQAEEVKVKSKQTWIKNYGVDNPSKSQDVLNKIADARKNLDIDKIIAKTVQTNIERYGNTHYCKTDVFKEKLKTDILKDYYDDVIAKSFKFEPLFTVEDYIGVRNVYEFKCKKCGDIFEHNMYNGMSVVRCFKCYPQVAGFSNLEKEVVEFAKSLNVSVIENDREIIKPLELDIYLPDNKLAIEFDGIYWHSSSSITDDNEFKNKHSIKTILCEQKGIQLLHIFENEWNEKQEIWKSIIKSKLGINKKIAARKCEVVFLENNEVSSFLEHNHLQGKISSFVNVGLKYNDELVSVLSIGKSRFNKNYQYEILRFANNLNLAIVGGFSKLLSHFRKNYKGSIITYADRRYSNGELYRTNGFIELQNSNPNYFYFKKNENILYSRMKFQKHKLKDLLENFDSDLSEAENMYNNGFSRIWDCGNKVFVSQ